MKSVVLLDDYTRYFASLVVHLLTSDSMWRLRVLTCMDLSEVCSCSRSLCHSMASLSHVYPLGLEGTIPANLFKLPPSTPRLSTMVSVHVQDNVFRSPMSIIFHLLIPQTAQIF